jgi:hypothetical protein
MTITMSAVGGIEGAPKIYYTLDGTDPRNSSTRKTYSSAITITGTKTLKAYAESGNGKSDVQTRVYTYIPPQEDPITISFQKPANWSKAYLYTWTANGEYPTGIWPGQQMTQTNAEGIYYQTLSNTNAREINFIFNNGAGIQSQNLLTYEDVCYGWENNYAVIINCNSTDVENVVINPTPVLDTNQPMYNILGQPVNATYKGIVIQNGEETKGLLVDGVFVAIGQKPENEPFQDIVALNDYGYIVSGENCLPETDYEGIFVAGDCRTKAIRQVTTATADGAVSALAACKFIDSL